MSASSRAVLLIADLGTDQDRAKRRRKVRRVLAAGQPRRASTAKRYHDAPLPTLAPCKACGMLSPVVEIRPELRVLGVIVLKANLRARCAEHMQWDPWRDELPAAPTAPASEPVNLHAVEPEPEPQAAPARTTSPVVIAAAVVFVLAVCGLVMQAAHESRQAQQTWRAQ